MEWTVRSFVEAREATERVLDELGLGNYLFDVEPRDDSWEIKVEYQGRDAWKVTHVLVPRTALEHSLRDPDARERLVAAFRQRLGDAVGQTGSAPAASAPP